MLYVKTPKEWCMNLVSSESDKSRDFWVTQKYLSDEVRSLVKESDVIITPLIDFRDGVELSFHQGTISFLNYLKCGLGENDLKVAICAPDDKYYEISLNSRVHRFSNMVVSVFAAPLVVSLMANYIYNELNAKPNDTISTSITVEYPGCKSYEISFDGSVKDFDNYLDKITSMTTPCDTTEEDSAIPKSNNGTENKNELSIDGEEDEAPRTILV